MTFAAGGIVYNERKELLMIFRNGKWDLPKGKLEIGESTEECALREVKEECGLSDLTIVDVLEDTYHTYELSGKQILKRTYWYKMFASSQQRLRPEISEGITRVCWVGGNDIDNKLKNSYANIQENLNDK